MAEKSVHPLPSHIDVSNFVTLQLTENNFLPWVSQLKCLARHQKLLGFLTGETSRPSRFIFEGETQKLNPDFEAWEKSDGLLKSWIFDTLSEEMLGPVLKLQTSEEVLQVLTDRFARYAEAREFDLLSRFYNLRKGSKTLTGYLNEFDSLCNQLTLIGKPLADSTKTFHLLEGLGRDYEGFITVMLRPPVPSYIDVVSQLQGFERRTGHGNGGYGGSPSSSPGSGFTQSTQNKNNQRRNSNQSGENNGSTVNSPITCQICSNRGHGALQCDRRFDYSYQPWDAPY